MLAFVLRVEELVYLLVLRLVAVLGILVFELLELEWERELL